MRAAIRLKYGPPELLKIVEINRPVPKDNEILVKVHAATVNRTDCGILLAKPFIMRFFTGLLSPKVQTTGTDFAGIIEAVGKNVTKFKVNERVWGFNDNGLASHAEYLVLPGDAAAITIPEEISYEEAAAAAEGSHYAYNFMNKVKLNAGMNVLVNGATGAIGSAALQFLKSFNITVTATANTKNLELIKSLGADVVVDYTTEDFTKIDQYFDFIFDSVGKSTYFRTKHLLKPGGVYISSELGPWLQNIFLPLLTKFIGDKKVIFPVPTDIKRSLNFIRTLLEEGKFKPVIDKIYSLDQIKEAYEYVLTGQKAGNVIITF